MRISSCESNCSPPLYCFKSLFCCYFPCFLRSRDAQSVSLSSNRNTNTSPNPKSGPESAVLEEEKEKSCEQKIDSVTVSDGEGEIVNLKSSLKRQNGNHESNLNGEKKGNVKWLDLLGKELAEIKEFEPSESGDSQEDLDENPPCLCGIQ